MKAEDLKKQVLSRVSVPADLESVAAEKIDGWVSLYPARFDFGPAAVMSAERYLRREMHAR